MSWAAIARSMGEKGGQYQLFLSLGGTLFLFLPMFGDALCQAQVAIVSNLLGTKNYNLLRKAFYSGIALAGGIMLFTAVPLIFCAQFTFHQLFPTIHLEPHLIARLFFGVWLSFLFFLFSYIPISDVLSFKDMKFSFFMGCSIWIYGYGLMKFVLSQPQIGPDQFWLYLSIMHGITALAYFWRSSVLRSRLFSQIKSSASAGGSL